MPPRRRGFFDQETRPEDEIARQREVEALLTVKRSTPMDIGVERIRPNPFQARKTFDNLEELAEAIRTQGFVSRLRVRPDPEQPSYFQLVYGERRLRAAALAGLDLVPCEVADHTDDELIEIGLAENIQRRDLDPLEEAQAFQTFITERGYSIRRLAERIGKDKSYVEDRLALLRTPEDVQLMIAERPDSLRAAREIAKLEREADRRPLIEAVTSGRLNTHDVRTLVRDVTAQGDDPLPAPERRGQPAARADAHERIRRTLAHDQRTIQAIFERWSSLSAQGDVEHALVSETLEETLRQAKRLTETLEQ